MKNIILFAALICAALTSPRLAAQDLTTEMTALGNAWKTAFERTETAIAAHTERVIYVNSKDGSETTETRAEIEADIKKTLEARARNP